MTHARFVQDWLEGWNTRDLDRIMAHYETTNGLVTHNVVYWGAEEVTSRFGRPHP